MRFVKARWRLLVSGVLGLVLIGLLPSELLHVTRLLIGWDAGIGLYLMLVLAMVTGSDAVQVRRHSAIQDEGHYAIPILTVTAALASLAAIVVWLRLTPDTESQPTHLALLFLTTILSWLFVHSIFALHYAHEYYGEGRDRQIGGMSFPGDQTPDYWDFAYFSFVIGMTFQVSDVQVSNRLIRRLVVTHGALSFVFNTAILAVTVNLATSAIGG